MNDIDPKYIVITGNPRDGFKYIGPFMQRDFAVEYADNNLADQTDWWIVELEQP